MQMKQMMKNLATLAVALSMLAVPSAALANYFPNSGDLYYNGYYFADSYLYWSNPGPWSVGDPGYEHDLAIRSTYFEDCTTWTNLPYGYDDCPTAGVLEDNSEVWVFSFGSYHARYINPGWWYYGSWNFSGGWAFSSDFGLYGQENQRKYCWFDSIWCMGATRTQSLLSGWFNWGRYYYSS